MCGVADSAERGVQVSTEGLRECRAGPPDLVRMVIRMLAIDPEPRLPGSRVVGHRPAWRAIASISTSPPLGSAATSTVERAGGGSGMKPA